MTIGDDGDAADLGGLAALKREHPFLLVVDARTMQEMGRADLPHHVPFSLGGEFFPRAELRKAVDAKKSRR